MAMRLLLWYGFVGWFVGLAHAASGQATDGHQPVRVAGRADYDSFFGFYPSLSLSKSLDSLHELSAYGILYTSPAFFGVETGLTLNRTTRRKTWSVMPGVGLVSGSVFVEGRPFAIGEGYVGSLMVQYEHRGWYGQGYGAYYGALKRQTPDTYDFGLYFLQAGRVLTDKIRVGILYGWLGYVRLPRNEGNSDGFDVSRFGLSVGLNLPVGLTLQVAGGLTHGAEQPVFVSIGIGRSLVPF